MGDLHPIRGEEDTVSSAGVQRSPDQIESDIVERRNRLATTIDTLVYRAHPKTIAQRQLETAKAHFMAPDGTPKTDNITKAAAIAAGVLVAMLVIRKLT
jgi:Protein of unknown function (DUF3618)